MQVRRSAAADRAPAAGATPLVDGIECRVRVVEVVGVGSTMWRRTLDCVTPEGQGVRVHQQAALVHHTCWQCEGGDEILGYA